MKSLSRREFLIAATTAASASILAACAPQATPTPEKVVEKVVETVMVAGTPQIIEREVTTTPVPPAAPEPYTVKMWTTWDLEKEMKVSELYAKFTAENPGLTIESTFIGEWETKFRTAAASGTLPDIYTSDGINIATYACRSLLADLTEIIPSTIRDDYHPPILKEVMWHGKQWGVPIECHAQGVYYNKDWLDKLGVPLPQTWAELLNLCQKIASTEKAKFGYSYPIGSDGWSMWWDALAMWQAGGRMTSEDESQVLFNSPENVEAVTYLQTLYQKHYVPRTGEVTASPVGPFFDQLIAVNITGSWSLQADLKTTPGFNWGWGAVPYGKVNVQGVSGGWHFNLSGQSKHKYEAGKVMTWLAGDEWGLEAAKRFRIISPRKSICAQLPELKNEPWTTALKMIDETGKVTRPHNTEYPNLMDVAGQALANATVGGKPVKDELDAAQEKMTTILANAQVCSTN